MLPTKLLAYAIGLIFGCGTASNVSKCNFRSLFKLIQAPLFPVVSLPQSARLPRKNERGMR
jgi:hypothetical protein